MLPDEVKVNFTIRPKLLLVSPLAVIAVLPLFYLPWGAESAPTWAQAFLSVVAILAAGCFPIWHERIKARAEERRLKKLVLDISRDHQLALASFERALRNGLDQPGSIRESVINSRQLHFWPAHLEALQGIDMARLDPAYLSALNTMKVDSRFVLEVVPLLSSWEEHDFAFWMARSLVVAEALDWIAQIRKRL